MITHNILSTTPFKVEFINHNTGTSIVETYAVALTKREIEAEYDYISFPPNKLQQLIDAENESHLNALENMSPEQ